jgi:hypothetical protein
MYYRCLKNPRYLIIIMMSSVMMLTQYISIATSISPLLYILVLLFAAFSFLVTLYSTIVFLQNYTNGSNVNSNMIQLDINNRNIRLPRALAGLGMDRLRLLATDRDFTGEDYETLLALDENIPTQMFEAATEGEIRRLPVWIIPKTEFNNNNSNNNNHSSTSASKRNNEVNQCLVCLEYFQGGDSVKTLPCLHRFHEHCADQWLRVKALCPICKFAVR